MPPIGIKTNIYWQYYWRQMVLPLTSVFCIFYDFKFYKSIQIIIYQSTKEKYI